MNSLMKDSISADDKVLDSAVTQYSQLGGCLNIDKPWTVSMLEKRGNFDAFLEEFQDYEKEFGFLLLKKFSCKGRSSQKSEDFPLNTIISKTEKYTKAPMGPWNDFQLRRTVTQSTLNAVLELEEEEEDEDELNINEFLDMLHGNESLGMLYEGQSLPSLRKFLEIGGFQLPIKVPVFQSIRYKSRIASFDKAIIQISSAGAPITVNTSLAGLTVSIYLSKGAAKTWFVVPPKEKKSFEERIRMKFFGKFKVTEVCSQFVRHLGLWLDTTTLNKWGVEYQEVRQEAGQLLVLLPGSYYWGFSHGFGISEMRYFHHESWTVEGYQFCKRGWEMCGKEKELQFKHKKDHQPNKNPSDDMLSAAQGDEAAGSEAPKSETPKNSKQKLKAPSSRAETGSVNPSARKDIYDIETDEDGELSKKEEPSAASQKPRRIPLLFSKGKEKKETTRRTRALTTEVPEETSPIDETGSSPVHVADEKRGSCYSCKGKGVEEEMRVPN